MVEILFARKSEVDTILASHPAVSTDDAIARYNGTAGVIQNSGVILDDSGNVYPQGATSDLGITTNPWRTLFLAATGTLNFGNGDVVITGGTNTLTFTGASSGYSFDASIILNNAVWLQWKDSGGVARNTINLNAGGGLEINNNAGGTGGPIVFEVAGVEEARIDGTGLTLPTGNNLFLPSGGVINFNASDVTIGHLANQLNFAGASVGYFFDAQVVPAVDGGSPLGNAGFRWSNLLLSPNGTVNWGSGNAIITHSAGLLSQNVPTKWTGGVDAAAPAPQINLTTYLDNLGDVSVSHLMLWSSDGAGANAFGFGMSAGQLNYIAGTASPAAHVFFTSASLANPEFKINATAVETRRNIRPFVNGGASLGEAALSFSALFLAAGSAINWANGGITITESTDNLLFAGATSGYSFDQPVFPTTSATDTLGLVSNQWSGVFLSEGAAINWDAGDATLTQSGNTLTVASATFLPAAGTATVAPFKFQSGTNLTTAEAGALEYDGKIIYSSPVASNRGVSPSLYFLSLSANQTGSNVATAQTWFPGGGATGFNVSASTSYFFEGLLALSRSAGTTSHTIGILFGGTATLTSIAYYFDGAAADQASFPITSGAGWVGNFAEVATNITFWPNASTSANEVALVKVSGIVRISAAGTFLPQFQYSAAPGGAPTVRANTWFRLWPIGTDTVLSVGNVS